MTVNDERGQIDKGYLSLDFSHWEVNRREKGTKVQVFNDMASVWGAMIGGAVGFASGYESKSSCPRTNNDGECMHDVDGGKLIVGSVVGGVVGGMLGASGKSSAITRSVPDREIRSDYFFTGVIQTAAGDNFGQHNYNFEALQEIKIALPPDEEIFLNIDGRVEEKNASQSISCTVSQNFSIN